ncbi:hypothetical protein B0H13DRAFT_417835 [Mycena leptocephala]|nr:hypothetical protein B0H13DRAFT_417835 [Mycena leptocephala]
MAGGLKLLKKGFTALEKHVSERKAAIQDRLKKSQHVDDEDATWLDGPANLVDEQRALDALENASDYEKGVSHLSDGLQTAVQRMKEFAAGVKAAASIKVPGTKRKSVCSQ